MMSNYYSFLWIQVLCFLFSLQSPQFSLKSSVHELTLLMLLLMTVIVVMIILSGCRDSKPSCWLSFFLTQRALVSHIKEHFFFIYLGFWKPLVRFYQIFPDKKLSLDPKQGDMAVPLHHTPSAWLECILWNLRKHRMNFLCLKSCRHKTNSSNPSAISPELSVLVSPH